MLIYLVLICLLAQNATSSLQKIENTEPAAEDVFIYVAPLGSDDTLTCGRNTTNACSLNAAATRARQAPSRLIMSPGIYSIEQSIAFDSTYSLSIIASEVFRVKLLTESPEAKISFNFRDAASTLFVANLTFAGFSAGAVSIEGRRTNVVINGCLWKGNKIIGGSGAAVLFSGNRIVFKRCQFDVNVAYGALAVDSIKGGAIHLRLTPADEAPLVWIEDCLFYGNSISSSAPLLSASGGVIRIEKEAGAEFSNDSYVEVTIKKCFFGSGSIVVNGTSWPQSYTGPSLSGGDLSIFFDSTIPVAIKIESSIFSGAQINPTGILPLSSAGGSISIVSPHPSSSLVILDSKFTYNQASAGEQRLESSSVGVCQGGALHMFTSGLLNISNSLFEENKCLGPSGGLFGAIVSGGAIDFSAVANSDSQVAIAIEDSTFAKNELSTDVSLFGSAELAAGGAIALQLRHLPRIKHMCIKNCTFDSNTISTISGDAYGGALSIDNIGTENLPLSVLGEFEISNTTFTGNSIRENTKNELNNLPRYLANLNGGAVYARLRLDPNTTLTVNYCNMSYNHLFPQDDFSVHTLLASAAAAFFDLTRNALSAHPAVLILSTLFEENISTGSLVNGGAVALLGDSAAEIRSSIFRSNRIVCKGPDASMACRGGAIYVKTANFILSDTSLLQNGVDTWLQCGTVSGGALHVENANLTIENTSLFSNFAVGGIAGGGAVSTYQTLCLFVNSSWVDNHVKGASAFGGAISTDTSMVTFLGCSFVSSRADQVNEPFSDCKITLDTIGGVDKSAGGAAAFLTLLKLTMRNVTFKQNQAHYGGSIFIASTYLEIFQQMEIRNSSIEQSTATGAGGALFFASLCRVDSTSYEWMTSMCGKFNISNTFVNSSGYGDICASPGASFLMLNPPPSHHQEEVWPTAPGDKKMISMGIYDAFGSLIKIPTVRVSVRLLEAPHSAVKMRSGAPQDSVFGDSNGLFTFEDFSLLGNISSLAHLEFTTNSPLLCPQFYLTPIVARFRISKCLPAYTFVDGLCQRCPTGTYTLQENATTCVPCAEEGASSMHEEIAGLHQCLIPPHSSKSPHDEHDHHQSSSLFEVGEGFYPAPSLEAPSRLEECPNDACLPFYCQPTMKENLSWYLNCSICPKHGLGGHEATGNQSDCHCLAGYEDRLCSRCHCPSDGSGQCYFFFGEREDHHCLLCKDQTTAVVVIAIIILQLSLVVFLLFQRSSLALLLAEAAIAITLLILGIGESWMLDLLLIMGLLFLATSFSKRLERKHPDLHSESDSEHEGSENNHHHGLDSQTASLAKITVFFVQSVASVVRDAAWPSWIETTMKQLEAFNLRVSGIECFAPKLLSEPLGKLVFQLSLPIFLGVSLSFAALIAAMIVKIDPLYRFKLLIQRCKKSNKRLHRPAPSDIPSDSENDHLLIKEEEENMSSEYPEPQPAKFSIGDLKSRVMFSSLFMLSASYFELSNTVLEIMKPCKHGYMAAIPWIPCSFSGSRYPALIITAIVFFVIYSIGIPGFFGFILIRNRRRIRAGDPALEAKYGFLYETYRHEVFWFELIWFLRRILLSIAVSVLTPRPGYQMAFVMFVLLGSLLLHRFVKPFSSPIANVMDLVATVILIFATTMGFVTELFQIGGSSHGDVLQNLIWISCALCAASLLIILVFPLLRAVHRYLRRPKSSNLD